MENRYSNITEEELNMYLNQLYSKADSLHLALIKQSEDLTNILEEVLQIREEINKRKK
jgi:hypothetical protein